jgi:hypothetical protein
MICVIGQPICRSYAVGRMLGSVLSVLHMYARYGSWSVSDLMLLLFLRSLGWCSLCVCASFEVGLLIQVVDSDRGTI